MTSDAQRYGLAVTVMVACLSSAVWALRDFSGSEAETARVILCVIAVALLVLRIRDLLSEPLNSAPVTALIWLVVAGLSTLALAPHNLLNSVVLAFCFLAVVQSVGSYVGGRSWQGRMLLPCFVLLLGVPALPVLLDAVTLPLRLISTQSAVAVLGLGGLEITARGTEIAIGDGRLAITAACSGITFLETMIWMAWAVVLMRRPPGWTRLVHFSFLIPVVVAGNTVRVAGLVLAYHWYGLPALTGPMHVWIGYVSVAVSAGLFMLLEWLAEAPEEVSAEAPVGGEAPRENPEVASEKAST